MGRTAGILVRHVFAIHELPGRRYALQSLKSLFGAAEGILPLVVLLLDATLRHLTEFALRVKFSFTLQRGRSSHLKF